MPIKSADKKVPIKNADKKMPIKAQQQLERIFQYLSEQSECTCKDVCALLEVKERRARQLLQELQEQGRIEAIGANKTRRYRLIKKRAESQDSLIIGFVACSEDYRRQGITKKLMYFFEDIARKKGFKYITLGSKEDAFFF